jgi:class 3 adenylate cyclase
MQQEPQAEQVAAAIRLLEDGDCFGAIGALDALGRREALPPQAQEALARSAWLCGDLDGCILAYERAYRRYLDDGNTRRAGFVALMLCWEHEGFLADARARGWRGRGERLLANEPDCVEHGYLALFRGRGHLAKGDFDPAGTEFGLALTLGERFGDPDLEALARWYGGYVHLRATRAEDGLALIDEAMASASGGELSAYFAGFVYCITIGACREIGDYRRAAEWTEAQRRWCDQTKVAVYPSICRVNRASVLGMQGAWHEAEDEAVAACRELERLGLLADLGDAYYALGELRLRRGDHAGAEPALLRAHELGWDPQPALAQLRLVEGEPGEARTLLENALAGESNPFQVVRLASALVEAALAEGDIESGRTAYETLESAVSDAPNAFGEATAIAARGRLRLAEGNGLGAIEDLRGAVRVWRNDVQAPFEAARAQVVLARAHASRSDLVAAAIEARTALATFDRLGAALETQEVRALLQELEPKGEPAVPRRVQRTFLFTDVVKSTELLEAIGDEAWHHLLAWHDMKLRGLFTAHGGEEVDHAGDGFFVAFPDATTAVECASAVQRALAEHQREAGFALQLRIGIHSAEATNQDPGYRGRGVHVAARIAALARAGEILASHETSEAVADVYRLEDRGKLELKGIRHPIAVVAVDWHDH